MTDRAELIARLLVPQYPKTPEGAEIAYRDKDCRSAATMLEANGKRIQELKLALHGMMIFYGMDEDPDNGACVVVWKKARAAYLGDSND